MLSWILLLTALLYKRSEQKVIISVNKTVTQSSGFNAGRAVDGYGHKINCGNSYSRTLNQSEPWLAINLGRKFRIGYVYVTPRYPTAKYGGDFQILIGNQPFGKTLRSKFELCGAGCGKWVSCHGKPASTVVVLKNSSTGILQLCEVRVDGAYICSKGTYGKRCEHTCSAYCKYRDCHERRATCLKGCIAGKEGINCSQDCISGKYGENCLLSCSKGCLQGTCHKAQGTCSCKDGYWDSHCGNRCSRNCLNPSNCTKGNGYCVCKAGYKHLYDSGPARYCEKECSKGYYGLMCGSSCSRYCVDGECKHTDGSCKCLPGYRNARCTEKCVRGKFGPDCSKICHCMDPTKCHHVTGKCAGGCKAGWKGQDCQQKCDAGKFGLSCGGICHCLDVSACDHKNGYCTFEQCADGWLGWNCQTPCKFSFFGPSCAKQCHCAPTSSCDHETGECSGRLCAPGWIGKACQQSCLPGKFGDKCKEICHCRNQSECNHTNGACSSGRCADGWTGHNCQEKCQEKTFGPSCNKSCHCLHNWPCDHEKGVCQEGCAAGWSKGDCQQSCTNGTFGLACARTCYCRPGPDDCDPVDGICRSGQCIDHHYGADCQNVDTVRKLIPFIVGGILGGLVLAGILISTTIVCYRRRPRVESQSDRSTARVAQRAPPDEPGDYVNMSTISSRSRPNDVPSTSGYEYLHVDHKVTKQAKTGRGKVNQSKKTRPVPEKKIDQPKPESVADNNKNIYVNQHMDPARSALEKKKSKESPYVNVAYLKKN